MLSWEKPLVKHIVPRVYFTLHKFLIYNSSFLFILFCNLYFPIYTTKIPKIFILLSLSDLTFASGREGIDNPFIALVASVQVQGDLCVTSYWIDTLVLKTEGNTYATLLHHPFLFKGKTDAFSRGSKKDFWRRCRGGLIFLSPTSPFAFSSPSSRVPFCLCFHVPSICLHLCLLKIYWYEST